MVSPNMTECISFDAIAAPAKPKANPAATGRIVSTSTSTNTSLREAPKAMRIPISCVRRVTANATVP